MSVLENANKLAAASEREAGGSRKPGNPLQLLASCAVNVFVVETQLGCWSCTIWITHNRHVSQIVHLTCFTFQM